MHFYLCGHSNWPYYESCLSVCLFVRPSPGLAQTLSWKTKSVEKLNWRIYSTLDAYDFGNYERLQACRHKACWQSLIVISTTNMHYACG